MFSKQASLQNQLYLCLYHFLGSFFLLFARPIPPSLQGLFSLESFITCVDIIFFEHSYASFSILSYSHLAICHQFTLHMIMPLSPASCKLLEGRGSLRFIASFCSSSNSHARTVSGVQCILKSSLLIWSPGRATWGLFHLLAWCLMKAAGSLMQKTQTKTE